MNVANVCVCAQSTATEEDEEVEGKERAQQQQQRQTELERKKPYEQCTYIRVCTPYSGVFCCLVYKSQTVNVKILSFTLTYTNSHTHVRTYHDMNVNAEFHSKATRACLPSKHTL